MPDNNRYARQTYSPDGSNREFIIDIPYQQASELNFALSGVAQTYGTHWTLTSPTTARFVTVPPSGSNTLVLTRNTDIKKPAVAFTSPGTFTYGNLNRIIKQVLFGVQESHDRSIEAETILGQAQDAANEAQINASAATASAAAAQASEIALNVFSADDITGRIRTFQDKLREVELSIEDFTAPDDPDDEPALLRAIASVAGQASATIWFNRPIDRPYHIHSAIPVTRGAIAFRAKHPGVTINSTSTTESHFEVGQEGGPYIFNVLFEGITFSRSNLCSAGYAIDIVNTGYATFRDIRVYGDSKQYSGIRARSCNTLLFENILTEHCLKEHGDFYGLSGGISGVDGNVINVVIDDWYCTLAHAASTDLATKGVVRLGDFCAGFWINMLGVDRHKGYALLLDGTTPNIAHNTLIYIDEINVESGEVTAGAFRARNYRGIYLNADWVSGKDLNTIHIDDGCFDVHICANTVAIAYVSTEASALHIDGQGVEIYATDCVGYSGNSHGTGLQLGPNADHVTMVGGSIQQLAVGFNADVPTGGKTYGLFATRSINNGQPAGFDLNASHDWSIVACPGLNQYLRGTINVGGSAVTAPLQVIADPSVVNRLNMFGGVASSEAVNSAAAGGDDKISVNWTSKGAGNHNFMSGLGHLIMGLSGEALSAGQTGIFLPYHNGTDVTAALVEIGDEDSGGAGKRALTVPN